MNLAGIILLNYLKMVNNDVTATFMLRFVVSFDLMPVAT